MFDMLKPLALSLGFEATVEVLAALAELVDSEGDLITAKIDLDRKVRLCRQPNIVRAAEGTVQAAQACVVLSQQALKRILPDMAHEAFVGAIVQGTRLAESFLNGVKK